MQSLRTDGSQREDDDDALYKRVLKDVCFLYHELADYRHIMGDLDYANDYSIHYWELLNRVDTGRVDDRFIRGGILILMLAMLQDVFDGSGDSISKHRAAATKALAEFIPEDKDMLRLGDAVAHGLQLLAESRIGDDRFNSDVCWAYQAFVRKYFVDASLEG
ncbi:hypothetical protein [Lacipirellula limnantheis]|uniref:Uncharacterized protein n=1 Tax=Lacipirellula limnantheis TaxID=2528024 RepID=A0A517TS94_9BACT|nr:hypothetical protein [Lacipirellula limnantheis]QDT71243.1 hypothetical protein I41_03990 [Lacipirellula limnantheis]